jgi:hypothetical protein
VPRRSRERGLDAQVRPPLEDALGVDVVDHDELGPARRARHEAHVPTGDVELVGEESEKRLVRRSLDRRCRNPSAQDPFGYTVDVVGPTTGCEADGEADVGRTQDNL